MVRDRLRRLIRGVARRAVGASPRIPNAGRTERAPPTTRDDWQPEPEPEPEPETAPEPVLELSAEAVLQRMNAGETVVLVDVRESSELWSGHARDAILAPMSQFQDLAKSLPEGPLLAIYCAAGARSYGIADYLRKNGRVNAWSIPEGFGGWVDVGGEWLQPATGTDWKLLQPVRLTQSAATERALEGQPAGQLQAVERVDGTLQLTVRTRDGVWIAGLGEHEVQRIGRG